MDKTRMQQYMSQMRAMFNKHALYSDESPQYQIPFEPNPGDTVKIRFRTLKNNVDAVYFISGSTRAQMQVGLVRNGFDYYEIEIPVGNEPIRYFFEIQAGRVVCYYNKLGVTRELQEMYSFGIIPGFHTPDWAKGAVMYQIFVTASAGVGVAEKVCAFIMLISSAFMQSMSAFVAQNYGAGRMDRAKKALYNGIGQTKFVMLQGIAGAFGVRVPVSYLMSLRPDTSLFKIGLATPMSSVVQLLLCLGFMVILNRRARKGEIR